MATKGASAKVPVLLMNPATKEQADMARRKRTTRKKTTRRKPARRKTTTRRAAPRRRTTTRKVTRRRTRRRKNPAMGDIVTAAAAGGAIGALQVAAEDSTELDATQLALAMAAVGIAGGLGLKKTSKPLANAVTGAGLAMSIYSGVRAWQAKKAEDKAKQTSGLGAVVAPGQLPGTYTTLRGVVAPVGNGQQVVMT